MNFHPFVSALIVVAVTLLILGCCSECDQRNRYVKVCRIDSSKEDCFEFRSARFTHGNTMVLIKDEDGTEYSFNKAGWSIVVMDKKERKRK